MIKKLIIFLTSFLLIFLSAGEMETDAAGETIQIAVNKANIREEPSKSSRVIGQADRNKQYLLLQEKFGWYQIQLDNGKKGWVAGYIVIRSNGPAAASSMPTNGNIQIAVDKANIRSEPINTGTVIAQASRNEQFPVLQEKFGWYQIQLPNGRQGWIAGYIVKGQAGTVQMNKTGTVATDNVHVRNNPSLSANILGKIHTGNRVAVSGEKNGFYHITFNNQSAWISKQYVHFSGQKKTAKSQAQEGFAFISRDQTNLRAGADTSSKVITKGSPGERYPIIGQEGDWYKITLASGREAYVASWVVASGNKNQSKTVASTASKPVNTTPGLAGKTIVLDAGHGGYDPGATSVTGTNEKQLTIKTAQRLQQKLKNARANVVLTRSDDTYVPLSSRAAAAGNNQADAFISLHYDSAADSSADGVTAYFYHGNQQYLASRVNQSMGTSLPLNNRGTRFGDFHVIRENSRPATLLELGYLSNPQEGAYVETDTYQDLVSESIYDGLESYFNK